MSLTIRPTVYELVLACGHVQLASRPLSVGHGYPCWTACDSEQATPETVAEVHRHEERMNETFVVCSGVNNGDMMHIQRVVDEANTKPSESQLQ